MAINSQLELIRKSIKDWNDWRYENSNVKIDLSEANLSNEDISGASLRDANLSGADLSGSTLNMTRLAGADLSRANLTSAKIIEADLNDANFEKAILIKANLTRSQMLRAKLLQANLAGADLSRADLSEADLRVADLSGVNFTKAQLYGAHLGAANINGTKFIEAFLDETNLTQTKGLETNFHKASLNNAILDETILKQADFTEAELDNASMNGADLTGTKFIRTSLYQADFSFAELSGADFTEAYLVGANFLNSNLNYANLTRANLENASFVKTNLEKAILTNCHIYGVSAWDIMGEPIDQSNLVITKSSNYLLFRDKDRALDSSKKAEITVDNLQLAQFVYLLLNRENLRNVLDTISSKAVLILGRFTPERKIILEAIADELRKHNLLPIIFDFERPTSRDFTETIKTLASISLFIIADITSPKSSPLELQAVVPDYQIPLVPIIQTGEEPFSMLSDLIGKHDWVLQPVIKYSSSYDLIRGFKEVILDRAWNKHQELLKKKSAIIETQSIDDFLEKSAGSKMIP